MPLDRCSRTLVAVTFGVALFSGAESALARGGAGHGTMPGQAGATISATLGSPIRSPPGSGTGQSGGASSGSGSRRSGGSSSGSSTSISNTAPLPFTTLTPSTGPSDGLPPRQELPQTIAPSLPQLPDQFATGGSSGVDLSSGSSSPSQSAPSTPGGGGKGLAACMGFWEPATHMSRPEWRATCLRTMQEYPSL